MIQNSSPTALDNFPRLTDAETRVNELGNFPALSGFLERRNHRMEDATIDLLQPVFEHMQAVVGTVVRSGMIAHIDLNDALDEYRKSQDALEQVAAWMRESNLTGVPMYRTVLDALEA